MTTAPVLAVKAALYTALQGLFPTAQVVYGDPGAFITAADLVMIGDANVSVERPTMGTGRSREHVIQQAIVFSCWRTGAVVQQAATEAAVALQEALSDYLRTSPNERLGGACRDAYITNYVVSESDDPDEMERGRRTDVACSLLVLVRN